MKATSRYYRIWGGDSRWEVREQDGGKTVWTGKTFRGARNAHARLTMIRMGVPAANAARYSKRMGN